VAAAAAAAGTHGHALWQHTCARMRASTYRSGRRARCRSCSPTSAPSRRCRGRTARRPSSPTDRRTCTPLCPRRSCCPCRRGPPRPRRGCSPAAGGGGFSGTAARSPRGSARRGRARGADGRAPALFAIFTPHGALLTLLTLLTLPSGENIANTAAASWRARQERRRRAESRGLRAARLPAAQAPILSWPYGHEAVCPT
jgi:hypothetical protein